MNVILKNIPLLLLMVFLPFSGSYAQREAEINWMSFQELSAALDEQARKVFLYFETDWCVYCRKMEKEVFTKPAIQSVLNEYYYAVKMDAETAEPINFEGQVFENRQVEANRRGFHDLALLFGRKDGAFAPPTMLVLDESFRVKYRVSSYLPGKQLLKLLK